MSATLPNSLPELDFDCAYSMAALLTGDSRLAAYAARTCVPAANHDDDHDMLLDGVPYLSPDHSPGYDWSALTGITGQYAYRGPIMHPSEYLSTAQIIERVRDANPNATLVAIVSVEAPCTPDDPCFPDDPGHCENYGCDAPPAGWAVLYR